MKRFIVTGGYGFIGSNLIRLLIKKKYKVLNIDNMSYSAQKYNLIDIDKKNYIFKKVDINNLMSKVREKEKKETKENLVFFGLVGSLIFISGILLSL